MYIDSLANVVAVQLLRQYSTSQPRMAVYEGGLPQRQLRQVFDYIHAHLDRDIKLADLAQLLGMSQFHFSHLFKRSMATVETGMLAWFFVRLDAQTFALFDVFNEDVDRQAHLSSLMAAALMPGDC